MLVVSNQKISGLEQKPAYHWHMNKYYSLIDESIMYQLTMGKLCQNWWSMLSVLHPSYKVNCFHNHKWLQDWIDEVVTLLEEEWKWYCPVQVEKKLSSSQSSVSCYYQSIHLLTSLGSYYDAWQWRWFSMQYQNTFIHLLSRTSRIH